MEEEVVVEVAKAEAMAIIAVRTAATTPTPPTR
jgi:hypothetical protein